MNIKIRNWIRNKLNTVEFYSIYYDGIFKARIPSMKKEDLIKAVEDNFKQSKAEKYQIFNSKKVLIKEDIK